MDPNKDRREAVKRKTTQYLKRAEEIFITHLQDNLGKGSTHLGVSHSSWLVRLKSSHKQELISLSFVKLALSYNVTRQCFCSYGFPMSSLSFRVIAV